MRLLLPLLACLLLGAPAHAQRSEMFGPFEVHHSVVNTTFLAPEVAAAYQIVRGKRRAIINFAVREHLSDGTTEARTVLLKGESWDLVNRRETLDFQEVREGESIYYIAQFEFLDREWRHFEIHFRPEGTTETQTLKFKQQVFIN